MKRPLKTLATAIAAVGILGWVAAFVASSEALSWMPKSIEFPLGPLIGVAVDQDEHIYCGSQFYSRVQKYAADGDAFRDFGREGERRWTTGKGTVFEIDRSSLFRSISRRGSSGDKETVVAMPLHFWFLMAPFPAWPVVAIGGLVRVPDRTLRHRPQKAA